MDYKNYRVGYHPELDEIGVIVFDDDISKYNYTKAEDELKHIVNTFFIDTYKFENYQNYLDENGLFMGIFPPEFIEVCFEDDKKLKREEKERIKKYCIESAKKPLDEKYIEDFKTVGASLQEIINIINNENKRNLKYGGLEFPIEKYYKDILIKYWGDYKL